MPAINQRIPNFIGGVSQQPDLLKFPGQVRICDNAVPDVTFGLTKRPPGEFVKALTNANDTGYWYNIIRDGDEKYLVQITPGNTGSHPIRVWNLLTGVEQSMTNSSGDSLYAYLAGATAPYAVQTVQDYTIIANPQKTIGTTGTTDAPLNSGNYAFARLDTIAYNTEYMMYTGATAPNPNTYWRATAVEVSKKSGSPTSNTQTGNTWDYDNEDSQYSGLGLFSFSGGNSHTLIASSGTYTRSGYTITVSSSSHGFLVGDKVVFDATSGSATDGEYVIKTVADANTFTITDSATGSISSSNCTIRVSVEDLSGHVTVNGTSYIFKQRYNWENGNTGTIDQDGNTSGTTSGDSTDFLGFTQLYKTRYTAQITLKDGGIIKCASKAKALATKIELSIEGVTYEISVKAVEEVETYEGVLNIAYYKSPKNPDKGKLAMITILENLFDSINANLANVTAEVIGSGLYLYGTAAPTVNFLGGAVNEAMNVIGNTAQNVSKLPSQCKQGYISQIANSDNVDADNYYVKFYADNGTQGAGKWEECVRPHNFSSNSDPMVKGFDPATMPHALINNRDGTFSFKKLDETTANAASNDNYWKYREVGDDITNPFPSFNGLKIQKIFFHRNRLGMIANEQVVLSRPGDYFNFFIVSAITFSDDNPIDITVSDIKPAFVNHVVPHNKGLMVFSDNGQFILFTESDIFGPKTARLKKVSSYECDASLQPVDMGTSLMFTSNVSAYTRTYESTVLDDDIPPKVIEQTRVVPEYIPKDITTSANSTPLGIVTFGKKNSTDIYHYKYFDAGEKREQSAWYSWTLTGTMQHMLYTGGSFWCVTKQGSNYMLNRYEYVTDATAARTYVVGGVAADVGSSTETARWFEACLDDMTIPTGNTYTAATGGNPAKTELTLPYTPTSADNYYVIGLSGNDSENVVGTINVTAGGSGYTVAPTVTISGGGGSGATATAYLKGPPASDSNLGVVDRITVDNVGSGYTSTPTVSFSGGNGTGATATAVTGNPVAGTVIKATSVTTNKAVFEDVDLTGWTVACGYRYTTIVELPNYYYQPQPNAYDIDGDLRISAFNFEMGVTGPLEFHIVPIYQDMDDFIQYESGMKLDDSDYGKPPSKLSKTVRVPIQRKNDKYRLQIKEPDPFSTALVSASWDGRYNQKRHARQ